MSLLQAVHLLMTSKTPLILYKPVTSVAGSKNALAHYEQSCDYNQISHALQYCITLFMAFMGAAEISLMSYPYTV